MFLDFGIRRLAPERLQARESSLLVGTHEPAVTSDIGGKNRGQPAFDAFRGPKAVLPNRMGRID